MSIFIAVILTMFITWVITHNEIDRETSNEISWRDEMIQELRSEIVTLKAQNKN
jgi:hypothetical protein